MTTTGGLLHRALPDRVPVDDPEWRWLESHGMPTSGEESWRYAPLDQLLAFEPQVDRSPVDAVDRDLVATAGDHGGPRLVLVDGTFAAELSDIAMLPAGVRVGWGPGAGRGAPGRRHDGFRALNWLAGRIEAEVVVAVGARIAAPIHIVHVTSGGRTGIAHPRTTIRVGQRADLTIIETYLGPIATSLTNAVTSITVERDACVRHHKIVLGPVGGAFVAHTTLTLDAGATAASSSVLTGVEAARNAIDVLLDAEGASVDLRGLDLPTGYQRHDTAVTVEHAASHCSSRQLFKAAVDDHARGSFSGRVIVRPGTVGNDADQIGRNLLLAPTAQADSRPWLEIFSDDVRCTHGSSTGRLDDAALFYLRARGIPVEDARAMLVGGFVAEMIESIDLPSLRGVVESAARRPHREVSS